MLNAAPRGIGAKQQRSERTIAIIGVPFCDTQSAYIHTYQVHAVFNDSIDSIKGGRR